MSAIRKIIASVITGGSTFSARDRIEIGQNAVNALTDAGYRILPPGALDPETLEAAVKLCLERAEAYEQTRAPGWFGTSHESRTLAAAILALKEPS